MLLFVLFADGALIGKGLYKLDLMDKLHHLDKLAKLDKLDALDNFDRSGKLDIF